MPATEQDIRIHVSQILNIKQWQVDAVLELSNEGCTVPFIARYRKEKTGNLDEVEIQNIIDTCSRLEEMDKRREFIIGSITETGNMTPEIMAKLGKAETLAELEDIYLPFKPRKKTLADKAIELGLLPLAEFIIKISPNKTQALAEAGKYLSPEVPDADTALEHAVNILAQQVTDCAEARKHLREKLQRGIIQSSVKRGKAEEGDKYRDYFEFHEPAQKIASHRTMAILRGEKEGYLNVSVALAEDEETVARDITKISFHKDGEMLRLAATDSLKRHLMKSIGNEVLESLYEKAELDSLEIFARNLEKIILFPPFGAKPVIGIDPGIRTGCKSVLLDQSGNILRHDTVFLSQNEDNASKLLAWAKEGVKGVAIGAGTFGKETYKIIKKLFKGSDIVVALVDEDGASIYSASETARKEFPDFDITVRGAISIGRRFQDPMAELVKTDPKSLGIGQYQHDIRPKLLHEKLDRTVSWAVNKVGVNLNTASPHLLARVSGLDTKKAAEIVNYRTANGGLRERSELKKVKGIGAKTFEQAAGFLRITGGPNPLDATGVHPESYSDVKKLASFYGVTVPELIKNPAIADIRTMKEKLEINEASSLLGELAKKGLDPREGFKETDFDEDISSIEDLKEGMVLNGMVDNLVAFGAFVDIGIKDKGLVHISEVSNTFIKDINSALAVGQEVRVKVIGIDSQRKRISLSIKQA